MINNLIWVTIVEVNVNLVNLDDLARVGLLLLIIWFNKTSETLTILLAKSLDSLVATSHKENDDQKYKDSVDNG